MLISFHIYYYSQHLSIPFTFLPFISFFSFFNPKTNRQSPYCVLFLIKLPVARFSLYCLLFSTPLHSLHFFLSLSLSSRSFSVHSENKAVIKLFFTRITGRCSLLYIIFSSIFNTFSSLHFSVPHFSLHSKKQNHNQLILYLYNVWVLTSNFHIFSLSQLLSISIPFVSLVY